MNITALQAHDWLRDGDAILIDVREPDEFKAEHIGWALSVPLSSIANLRNVLQLPKDKKVIFQCLKGGRGTQACTTFKSAGYDEAYNIEGGITGWKESGLPVIGIGSVQRISIFRQVQIIVGAFVAASILLGFMGITIMFAIAGIFGAALIFAGVSGWCGLAILLSRMPWNRP